MITSRAASGPRTLIAVAAVAAMAACGCHSALFQTAKIRNGVDATVGVTRVRAAEKSDVSDYSIFVRGEVGKAARRSSFGYSFAMSMVSPLKNKDRATRGAQDWEDGTYPNESAGVLPEFKLQFPRKIPIDFALNLRLMAIHPERIAVIASEDAAEWLTFYQSYAISVTEGQLLCLGAELSFTKTVSLLIEGTTWLSAHDYPRDIDYAVRKYPYSFGLALSYHIPRASKPDQGKPRDYASARGL
jgi:hypothetical protein